MENKIIMEGEGIVSGGQPTTTTVADPSTTQTGADQMKGTQSNANDDFLKIDPDKTGEIKKTVEELDKIMEVNKKLQSNFDKEKAERLKIEAELKKEREKTLTDKQLEELRKQELEQLLKTKESEIFAKELQFNKSKMLFEKGWDNEFLDIIGGNDLPSFEENCKKLQAKMEKIIEKRINERLAKGNPTPGSSQQNLPNDIFTVEEINNNRTNSTWVKENLDKLQRSITYHNKK